MTSPTNVELAKEFSDQFRVHKNLSQEVVVTTVDKLRICLMENRDTVAAKHEWITPFSLLLTFLTTLVAADFKPFVMSPETWKALYVFFTIGSMVFLVRSVGKAWRHRAAGSLDQLVSQIKASGDATRG